MSECPNSGMVDDARVPFYDICVRHADKLDFGCVCEQFTKSHGPGSHTKQCIELYVRAVDTFQHLLNRYGHQVAPTRFPPPLTPSQSSLGRTTSQEVCNSTVPATTLPTESPLPLLAFLAVQTEYSKGLRFQNILHSAPGS